MTAATILLSVLAAYAVLFGAALALIYADAQREQAELRRWSIQDRLTAIVAREREIRAYAIDPFTVRPYGADEWQTAPAPSDLQAHARRMTEGR